MSVPVNERGQGKLTVCVKAHELCCYTLQITANEKVFTEKYREALTNRIVDTAIGIHTLCWTANNVLVNSEEDLNERTAMQEKAVIECNNLLSYIQIAKKLYHLSTKRVTYWGGQTAELRKLIRAWRDSDRKRYAQRFR